MNDPGDCCGRFEDCECVEDGSTLPCGHPKSDETSADGYTFCAVCAVNPSSPVITRAPYYALMSTCDGLYEFEVTEMPPDPPWPAMVRFEFTYGATVVAGTMTADDAKELVGHLGAAAELAYHATREAVRT